MAKRFLYRTRSDSHARPSLFEVWVTLHVPQDKESKLYVMKIIDMSRMDPKQRKDPTMTRQYRPQATKTTATSRYHGA